MCIRDRVGAAQWAGDRTRDQLLVLGGSVDPFTGIVIAPSESTIRGVLTKLDPRALTVACVAWTLARLRDVEQRVRVVTWNGPTSASRILAPVG